MEDLLRSRPELGSRRLDEWIFIGTHDSGAYNMQHATTGQKLLGKTFLNWSQCQSRCVLDQLRNGVRTLDLRVAWVKEKYHIVHGPVHGPPMSEVWEQLEEFLESAQREVLLIKFVPQNLDKHGKTADFAALIRERLERHIYSPKRVVVTGTTDTPQPAASEESQEPSQEPPAQNMPNSDRELRLEWGRIDEITAAGPRVVAFYPPEHCGSGDAVELVPLSWITGRWIDTSDLQDKIEGLRTQLSSHPHDSPSLYNLQWTLTPQVRDTIRGFLRIGKNRTVECLSKQINPLLPEFLKWMRQHDHMRKVNLITMDFEHHLDLKKMYATLAEHNFGT